VICSDGLWAYFDDAEMGRIVAENSARRASEILVDAARARAAGAGDNLSLVIIKLNEARPAVAAPVTARRQ
jgi:serine/threonine protein phosphatase PrpC